MNTETVTIPPAVLAAAETLAAALTRVEPIAAYRRAQARLRGHPTRSRAAGAPLGGAGRPARPAVMRHADATDLNNVRALQQEVRSDPIIMDYIEAQQAAIAYLPEVNQEIGQLLGMDFAAMAGPASC